MKPVFSIVIPVYNRQDTIGPLLTSIFSCKLPFAIEIIIINSGSTDNTLTIIDEFKDKRIRVISINKNDFNHGLTRNLGVNESKGDYVFFFSGDALVISKNIFTRTLATFKKFPDCVISFVRQTPYEWTPFIQQLEATVYFDDLDKYTNSKGQVVQNYKNPFIPFEGTNKMLWYFNSDVAACYRRDYLIKYPFPKTEHGGEDVFAAKQALELGYSKIYDSKLIVQHSHSYSFWEYVKRESVEVKLVSQLLEAPKKIRYFNKVKKIIQNSNFMLYEKIHCLFELCAIYSAKLFIFLFQKISKLKIFAVLVAAQICIIVGLSVYIYNAKREQYNIAPLSKNSYHKTEGELNYFYEPANFPFEEPYPWDPTKKIMYTMNKDTVRSNRDYAIPKPPNTLRIVTIGDSFTFGQFVEDDETYPAQLETLLKEKLKDRYDNVEVINLGVPGYDIEYAKARYEKRGRKYQPDIIIWFVSKGDLTQINEAEITLVNTFDMVIPNQINRILHKVNVFYLEHQIARIFINTFLNKSRVRLENIERIYCLSHHINGVLYVPLLDDVISNQIQSSTDLQGINFFVDNNLPNLYLSPLNYFPDTHPTKEGYKIISNHIGKFIIKNLLVKINQ